MEQNRTKVAKGENAQSVREIAGYCINGFKDDRPIQN